MPEKAIKPVIFKVRNSFLRVKQVTREQKPNHANELKTRFTKSEK